MQEINNSVETSELLETFDGMELIEDTLLANVSGAAPEPRRCGAGGVIRLN